jgi:Uncharacterised nucleotidyltransferase
VSASHLLTPPGSRRQRLGALIASVLRESWRPSPPAVHFEGDALRFAAPLLLGTGGAGLAWWRVRDSGLSDEPVAAELRDAFRAQTLDARLHEDRLKRAVQVIEAAGVPVLISKGWSVARRYPAGGLRPYGDLDLHVPLDSQQTAERALAAAGIDTRVDLHAGVGRLDSAWTSLWERSRSAELEETALRVLADEDHLRLLGNHFLAHGAWRPLWLCDIGVMIEAAGESCDWDRATEGVLGERLRVVVWLAHRVLGARLDATPWTEDDALALPPWLTTGMLRAWGEGGHYSLTTRIALTGARPAELISALRIRWPNPIEATFRADAPFDDASRWPYQLRDVASRLVGGLPESARLVLRRALRH